jgi:Flp pilus assembly pilin Flp
MDFMYELIARLQVLAISARTREEGQTLVEYSLIIAMVSIGSIAVLLALSGKINGVFTQISGVL